MGICFSSLAGTGGASTSGGAQGVGGNGGAGLSEVRQPSNFVGAAATSASALPTGAAPQLGLPVGVTGGVQSRKPSEEKANAFLALVKKADVTADEVREALEECPGLVFVKYLYDGSTLLHKLFSSAQSHPQLLDIATLLVERGAPLGAKNGYGFTPLHVLFRHASQHSQLLAIAALLIQFGPCPYDLYQRIEAQIQATLHAPPPDDASQLEQHKNAQTQALVCKQALAIYQYVYHQTAIDFDVLTKYMNSNDCTLGNINDPMTGSMNPPLWHAIAHLDAEAVKLVFNKGVHSLPGIVISPMEFMIHLRYACDGNNSVSTKLDAISGLFTQRWKQNEYGPTPLHLLSIYASKHPQLLEMVTLLVNAGAPLDTRSSIGSTPLALLINHAHQHPQLLEMVTLLLQYGPYPDDIRRKNIEAKIDTVLNAPPPDDADLLEQYENAQRQALVCKQALAICPYGYLQTVITLDVLTNYINSDDCTPANINNPMPGSMYPALWHAVAHGASGVEGAVALAINKSASFLEVLPGIQICLMDFMARLRNAFENDILINQNLTEVSALIDEKWLET